MDEDGLGRFFRDRFCPLSEGQTIEIRAFPAHGGGRKAQEFFTSPAAAAAFALGLPADLEIYYGVNPRRGRGGKKEDVDGVNGFHCDCDDKKFGGDAALSEEACFALDLPPSFVTRSGHGWQPVWQLDEPLGPEEIPRAERICQRIAFALGGMDSVHDAGRIFRVPGTWNNKDPQARVPVTLDHDTGRVYTVEQIEAMLPALPPEAAGDGREVAHLLGPDDIPSQAFLREVLGFCDPNLPRDKYICLWMAVARYYPDADGMALVDEWSSDAREAAGQATSPRTRPELHASFRRQTGRVATIGTIVHHAKLGGWKPPEKILLLPTTGKGRRKQTEDQHQERLAAAPNPGYHDLPHYLRAVYDLLGPLTEPLDRDFTTQMVIAGWSQFFFGWRVENLPLNIWALGVAGSGAGKNLITDAIIDLYTLVRGHSTLYTSGSPEGLLRQLDGDKKSVHCYFDEFADMLKSLDKDYMAGMPGLLCSLHDGRDIAHRLSKQSLVIANPYATVLATTTPNKLIANMRAEDLDGGLASRFWITLPKTRSAEVRHRVDRRLAQELADAITQHLADLGGINRAVFYREVPDELVTLERELGIGGSEWRTFEDELADPRIARGRHVSRWKVIATLLELMRARPAIENGCLLVTEESCRLALALVRRAVIDQERLILRLSGSEDARSLEQVRRAIERAPAGLTKSDLLRKTRVRAQELGRILQVLEDSRDIDQTEDASGRVVWTPVGGRAQARKGRA